MQGLLIVRVPKHPKLVPDPEIQEAGYISWPPVAMVSTEHAIRRLFD